MDPVGVAEVMEPLSVWWAIAGCWAIDLWLGATTREHHDVEVVVRRRGQSYPHLDPLEASDAGLALAYLSAAHGGSWHERLANAARLASLLVHQARSRGGRA